MDSRNKGFHSGFSAVNKGQDPLFIGRVFTFIDTPRKFYTPIASLLTSSFL